MGVATPYESNVRLRSLDDWKEISPESAVLLRDRVDKVPWLLPGKPRLEEDQELYAKVKRSARPYIDFHDVRFEAVFASWIICSGIAEFFSVSVRLIITGLKGSGKTNLLRMIAQLAYRGLIPVSTTAAVLFRRVDQDKVTYALDEMQRYQKDSLTAVMTIYNGGFDASPVERYNADTRQVEMFRTRAFMALAAKKMIFQDDELDRALLIPMRKTGRKDIQRAPGPYEYVPEFLRMRGELLGFWLLVIAGEIDLKKCKERARDLLDKPITINGVETVLTGRARDIAEVLIIPPLLFGDSKAVDDILELIIESSAHTEERQFETLEVQTFLALHDLVGPVRYISRVYIRDIKDALLERLSEEGSWEIGRQVDTREVSRTLRILGFELETKGGAQNKSFVDLSVARNLRAYEDRLKEFRVGAPTNPVAANTPMSDEGQDDGRLPELGGLAGGAELDAEYSPDNYSCGIEVL